MEQQNELEKIKKEILSEVKPAKKDKRRLQWGSIVVTSVLVVLTLFSVVQAVQSATILNKINSGDIKPASAGTSGSAPLPSSLQNLPNMVGGC
jgi:hypothetical protein